MESLDVLLDWLVEHGESGVTPVPASEAELQPLRDLGAPDAVLALAARLGRDVPGVLPPIGDDDEALPPLHSPRRMADARQALLEFDGGVGDLEPLWPIGGSDASLAWAMDARGHLVGLADHEVVAGPTPEEAFFHAHLLALQAGDYAWHPGIEAWVRAGQLPDLTAIPTILATAVSNPGDLFEALTRHVFDGLLAGGPVALGELGTITVSHRSAFTAFTDEGAPVSVPGRRIPVFRAGGRFKARLNGQPLPSRPPEPFVFPGLDDATSAALIDALVDGLAERLIAGATIGWPGLGQLSASIRRSFSGHNPRTGAAMTVPSRRIPVFRSWLALKRALNPD
ncbi:MAG: HU family DNA-binding protein [Alphaproteobacteria bacterium]|nr:HU family DNA-binding protein [Alphaproteobacteria bacterium]